MRGLLRMEHSSTGRVARPGILWFVSQTCSFSHTTANTFCSPPFLPRSMRRHQAARKLRRGQMKNFKYLMQSLVQQARTGLGCRCCRLLPAAAQQHIAVPVPAQARPNRPHSAAPPASAPQVGDADRRQLDELKQLQELVRACAVSREWGLNCVPCSAHHLAGPQTSRAPCCTLAHNTCCGWLLPPGLRM